MSDNASSVKTILLVEDDFALAMGTEYTLKAEGYGVVHAKNLAEAREALNVNDPAIDLILLDVMLPDGDGFSFLEELVDAGAETPVIFATAVGDEVNIVRGLDLGADDYITKPYKVKEMLSRDEISGTEFGLAISLAQFPLCGKKARPSVETGFHAMLPRYVIHHHSVYANFISCCRSGLEMSMELFPECRFIPFCMPGMELCLAIRENLKYRPLRTDKPEIFFFANHGLAVAAGDAETACKAMHYVNDSIKKYYRLPVFCPCPDSHSVLPAQRLRPGCRC